MRASPEEGQVLCFWGCNRGKTNRRRKHRQPLRWNEARVRAQQQGVPHIQLGDPTKQVTKRGPRCLFPATAGSNDSLLLCFKGSWGHCRTPRSFQKPFRAPRETAWILPRSAAFGDGLQTSHLEELSRKRDLCIDWEKGGGRKAERDMLEARL